MKHVSWLLALVALCGCGSSEKAPDLGEIYSRAAMVSDRHRNPVIVIPGILGSKLAHRETGQIVWGAFTGQSADPDDPEGARLMSLPMREGVALRDLPSPVGPAGVLDTLQIDFLGVPVEVAAYVHILGALGVGGYRDRQLAEAGAIDYGDDHFTCFQFAYDWRRDNAENAARLHEYMLETRAFIEKQYAERGWPLEKPIKFDIVAHSMGGLVTRYYLRYGKQQLPDDGSLPELNWAGTELVDRAIIVGTPNLGSTTAVIRLTSGISFAKILPSYEEGLLGTMPAIYQLLPRDRHGRVTEDGAPVELFDPETWEAKGWGLADPDQADVLARLLPDETPEARRRIALDHLRKCLARAEQFHRAMDVKAPTPPGLLYLFAGDSEPTIDAMTAASAGDPEVSGKVPGDGTVSRWSALGDESAGDGTRQSRLDLAIRWTQVHFLAAEHIDLTRKPGFTDNVLYLLLLDPRVPFTTGAAAPRMGRAPRVPPALAGSS